MRNTKCYKFIFINIINNIANYNSNYQKYLSCIAKIYKKNYEINFYTIIIVIKIEENYINGHFIYIILIIEGKIQFYNIVINFK